MLISSSANGARGEPATAIIGVRLMKQSRRHLFLIALLLAVQSTAFAQAPSPRWAPLEDSLARVLLAEAESAESDWPLILWVLEHRRIRSGARPISVIRYSASLRMIDERARMLHTTRARQLPASLRRVYLRARRLIRRWLRARVPDECPRSTHWKSPDDPHRRWFSPLGCGAGHNVFGRDGDRDWGPR